MDSYFVKHESCPRCGSRDNLGVWSDGHKYCFGCRYYVAPPETIENLQKRFEIVEKNNNNAAIGIDPTSFSYHIPDIAVKWIKKYGVSDSEIKHYALAWNPDTLSLVFPIYNIEKVLIYCQERYFGSDKNHPKYITYGSKTQQLAFIYNQSHPKSIVLVEDFISAIKVARLCSASPLLGAAIDSNAVKWIVGRFNRVRVWLDLDKAAESLREASRLIPAVADVRTILTQLDPKEYTTEEIGKTLAESGIKKG